jgi:hypothetical protein
MCCRRSRIALLGAGRHGSRPRLGDSDELRDIEDGADGGVWCLVAVLEGDWVFSGEGRKIQ